MTSEKFFAKKGMCCTISRVTSMLKFVNIAASSSAVGINWCKDQ